MRILSILFTLSLLPIALSAQDTWWIGLEAGHAFHQLDEHPVGNTFNFSAGVLADIPLGGRVFLSTGLLRKRLGHFEYRSSTGRSTEAEVDGELITVYEFEVLDVHLDFWSVPMRLKYRIPGDVLFVQAGIEWDFRDLSGYKNPSATPTNIYTNQIYTPDLPSELKNLNATIVLGLGFELHKNEQIRLILRPEYEFIINPARSPNLLINQDLIRLRINLGAQYLLSRTTE